MTKIIHISDPHVVPSGQLAYGQIDTAAALASGVETANGFLIDIGPVDMAIVTGDLVATVENAFFLGDRTRLILAGKDNQRLTVDTSGPREYRVGETLGLSIDSTSLLALEN